MVYCCIYEYSVHFHIHKKNTIIRTDIIEDHNKILRICNKKQLLDRNKSSAFHTGFLY